MTDDDEAGSHWGNMRWEFIPEKRNFIYLFYEKNDTRDVLFLYRKKFW